MDCKKGTVEIADQVLEVLAKIPAEQFSRSREIFRGSSIGQHFRHIIEFYHCLIEGTKKGKIDYAARKRSLQLEQDIELAADAFRQLKQKVYRLDEQESIQVLADFATPHRPSVGSTVGRELMFAYDHAVHHLAIIRIGLENQFPQIAMDDDFGLAPSTIKHRKNQ